MQQRGAVNVSCKGGVLQGDNHLLLEEVKLHWLMAEEVSERKQKMYGAVEVWKRENMPMEEIEGGHMKMEKQELSGSV